MAKYYLIGLIIFCSIVTNGYQAYQIQQFEHLSKVVQQKDALVSNGYDEIVINYLEKIKSNQETIIKEQGRLEGILAVVHNYNPDENVYSALWHDGYNHGESSGELATELSYEDGYHKALEDMYCPSTSPAKKSFTPSVLDVEWGFEKGVESVGK